jgi:predicted anti-sigma-YlaC factor YlaD
MSEINMKGVKYDGSKITLILICLLVFCYVLYVMFYEETIIDVGEMKKYVKMGDVPF